MRLASLIVMLALAMPAPRAAAQVSSSQVPNTAGRVCVEQTWGRFLAPGPQEPIPVEQVQTKAGAVGVFRFDALKGDFAKLYIFVLFGEDCARRAYVVGSYEMTAATGPAGKPRLYHADLYTPQAHFTMGFFEGPPAYEDIRGAALEALQ